MTHGLLPHTILRAASMLAPLRATRRMAQGMALGALVYPEARGSAILPGRFPRRDLGEAEQRAACMAYRILV